MSLLSPFPLILLFFALLSSALSLGHESESSGSCPFSSSHGSHHSEDHDHHNHDHDHHHHFHGQGKGLSRPKLPEELAEEDDLELSAFGSPHRHASSHDHGDHQFTKLGLWIHAMGCSLLVSMCSLICLIILPVVLLQGKPSKTLVDSLAAFGAGAMLGDSFLHQLPHAFGGGHLHSHDHHLDHSHGEAHHHGHSQSHSHSLEDLSVGLSILSGIVLFLLVEKVVRYVEDLSGKGAHAWGHGHHHHFHHKSGKKLQDDDRSFDEPNARLVKTKNRNDLDAVPDDSLNDDNHSQETFLRKRSTSAGTADDNKDAPNGSITKTSPATEEERNSSPSNKVFGYLNLFSDGVHNFTDGMALGSAFLLYGSVGGWSRTLFLIAHELPQEVGDFGILVRSGFSASKALFFNFLSALVALAGTALVSARLLMRPALALILGQDPGQSSLIEGFTAGGFIYIAVAGVLPEMNGGNSTLKSSVIQLTSLISGMAVALCISLLE